VKFPAWSLALLAPALAAQTVMVEGTVANSVTRAPLAGVTVRFFGHRNNYEAPTDAAGGFRIRDVAPDTYSVMAAATGFSTGWAELPVDGGTGPPPLRLTLAPFPDLAGQVLDAERRPVPNTAVQALRRRNVPVPVTTDDAGRFRFSHLEPGEYVLQAMPPPAKDSAEATEVAPTFFPNVTDRAQATAIAVTAGNDLAGYDIVLQSVPVLRVSGRVLDERGDPAAGAAVQITTATAKASAAEDGAFLLARVRPGDGRLRADLTRGGVDLRGFASVTVARHDMEGIDIRVSPPVPVTGTVELDGKPALNVEGTARLVPVDGRGSSATADFKDGGVRFDRVFPGRYRLSVEPGWTYGRHYLEAVWLAGRDITLEAIEVVPDMLPFRAVLRTGGGSVRGTVENGAGGMIVLAPRDERMRVSPFLAVSFFHGSQFELDGVRPGEYYAFAIRQGTFSEGEMQDPAYAGPLLAGAPAVRIEPNVSATLTLLYVKLP